MVVLSVGGFVSLACFAKVSHQYIHVKSEGQSKKMKELHALSFMGMKWRVAHVASVHSLLFIIEYHGHLDVREQRI